jgi:hypothetical protein
LIVVTRADCSVDEPHKDDVPASPARSLTVVIQLGILVILAATLASFAIWAWLIKRRLGPPPHDRPGHETERYHFKYGGEPPGVT